MYKAENWIGKIQRGQFVRATLDKMDKAQGLTLFDVYPDGLGFCDICGKTLWHHWEFFNAGNDKLIVGRECAKVATGNIPPGKLLAELIRKRIETQEAARYQAEQKELMDWWTAPGQSKLRTAILSGLEAEEQFKHEKPWFCCSDYYHKAYELVMQNRMSPKFRLWVERQGIDGKTVTERTSKALEQLYLLYHCNLSRYDAPFIEDIYNREFPYDPCMIQGSPLSEKQCAAIAKIAKRYRKQIEELKTSEGKCNLIAYYYDDVA